MITKAYLLSQERIAWTNFKSVLCKHVQQRLNLHLSNKLQAANAMYSWDIEEQASFHCLVRENCWKRYVKQKEQNNPPNANFISYNCTKAKRHNSSIYLKTIKNTILS